jgi:hypothetical protein
MWYLLILFVVVLIPVAAVLIHKLTTGTQVKVVQFGMGPYPDSTTDDSYAWAYVKWDTTPHAVLMLRSRTDDQLVWVASGDYEWYHLVPQRVRDVCEMRYQFECRSDKAAG